MANRSAVVLSGARFDGANLRRCAIGGGFCGFQELNDASFRDADMSGSTVNLLLLDEQIIDFTGANLEKAVLNTGPENLGCVNFKNARMKACKVTEALLPQLSERQRAEVEVMVPVGVQTPDEQEMAATRDRRFRSVPILASQSQMHSTNYATTLVTQTTYNLSDVREHVLKNHARRHLLTWEWPLLALAAAVIGLVVQHAIDPRDQFGMLVVSGIAGIVGAGVGGCWNETSRRLYRRQARKDRGWKVWEKRPKLHIVFEHEWREFISRLR
jgi:hypothetical protein